MMIIDSHQHFWALDRGDYDWLTPELAALYRDYGPEDLKPILTESEVSGTVVVQAAATEAETRFLLDLAKRYDFIEGVVGWLDMESPRFRDAAGALIADAEDLFKGVRPMIQDIVDPDWILSPKLDGSFEFLAAESLTFDALVLPVHLSNLLKRLGRHPELKVVVDHCAKPRIKEGEFDEWRSSIAAIARETDAYCKLSGLLTEAAPECNTRDLEPYVDAIFEEFGENRTMWGSDWPVVNLAASYSDWLRKSRELCAAIAPDAEAKVFGANAARFYNIDKASGGVSA